MTRRSSVLVAAAVCVGVSIAAATSTSSNNYNGQPLHAPLEAEEFQLAPPGRRLRDEHYLQQAQRKKQEEMSNSDLLPLPEAFLPNITDTSFITSKNFNNLKQPRIIGGESTTRDRYPYAASLVESRTNRHVCGGSLIAPDIILTAGHCSGHFDAVQIGRHNIIDGELEAVLMNNNNGGATTNNVTGYGDIIDVEEEDGYEFHVVERHVVHPLHANVIRSDFAVAKLFGSVSTVRPVNLNKRSDIPSNDEMVTVMGYGIIKKEGSILTDLSKVLLEADVQYMTNAECAMTSAPFNGQTVAYNGYIDDNMLCAWELDTDACQGDSGGPLIYESSSPSSNNPEDDVQVGIVSWGLGCALESFPGVYSRISEEIDWLTEQVCNLSDDPPDHFNCTISQEQQQQQTVVMQDVTVVVELDEKPKETAWMLGLDTMNAGGTRTGRDKYKPFGSYTSPLTTTVEVLSLVANKQYKFTMLDRGADNQNTKFRLCYGNVSKEECMRARRYDEDSIVVCEGISRYNLITSASCPIVLQTERPTPRPTVSPTFTPTDAPMQAVWNDLMFGTFRPFFKPPTLEPTMKPTLSPTSVPSVSPTDVPTPRPSVEPSVYFTKAPAKDAPTDFFSKFDTDELPEAEEKIDYEKNGIPSAASKRLSMLTLVMIAFSTICYYFSSW